MATNYVYRIVANCHSTGAPSARHHRCCKSPSVGCKKIGLSELEHASILSSFLFLSDGFLEGV